MEGRVIYLTRGSRHATSVTDNAIISPNHTTQHKPLEHRPITKVYILWFEKSNKINI